MGVSRGEKALAPIISSSMDSSDVPEEQLELQKKKLKRKKYCKILPHAVRLQSRGKKLLFKLKISTLFLELFPQIGNP